MDLKRKRWLRALSIAKSCFEEQGYHTRYLEEIGTMINDGGRGREAPPLIDRRRIT